jgi:hypothetical protein
LKTGCGGKSFRRTVIECAFGIKGVSGVWACDYRMQGSMIRGEGQNKRDEDGL